LRTISAIMARVRISIGPIPARPTSPASKAMELIRNTPFIVQLFLAFFGLRLPGVDVSP